MKIEIKVPQAGESVTEAMISEWFKQDGERVEKDDVLLELETDKTNLELHAEESGVLSIAAEAGEEVTVDQVIGTIDTEAAGEKKDEKQKDGEEAKPDEKTAAKESEAPPAQADKNEKESQKPSPPSDSDKAEEPILAPAAKRVAAEAGLDPTTIRGTGKDGRVTKEDAQKAADQKTETPTKPAASAKKDSGPASATSPGERVVPMSMMRRRIAERLVEAQRDAAILTTFNEVDMSAVMALRNQYKQAFEKKYEVRLGFMSFFVKACVEALREIPEINARIEGNSIVYRDHYHVGVAVGSAKGLVVPVIRHADQLSFAEIERNIGTYAAKARDGKISLDDLSGGTFTISNGGIYGSLLSTPILNPPQSGILGMHKIEKRPVVVGDQVVVRPMMYLALSYDHRIVDGKGAVTFLVKVKECLEDPARILLEI